MPSLSGIVVAESIYKFVPQRIEFCDEKRLAERYPDVIPKQVSAMKVRENKGRSRMALV
jgi:asparagine synthetase A